MVSDNDCDVAVCDIKGRGDFSPPSDFVCTSYIQNLCLHIPILRYTSLPLLFRFHAVYSCIHAVTEKEDRRMSRSIFNEL